MTTYLLLGEDEQAKDREISGLKERILRSAEVFHFDYEVLYGHKLGSEDLKKALVSLPAIAPKRLLVIRECHRLNPHNKELVLEFAASKKDYAVLVLESAAMDLKDKFVQGLGRNVKILDFRKGNQLNVFDLTRMISMRQETEALKILSKLFLAGEHPLRIMGGLVWFWGTLRGRLSREQFEDGLLALQEADLNIKRSRLDPEHALEVAVVKLCFREVLGDKGHAARARN